MQGYILSSPDHPPEPWVITTRQAPALLDHGGRDVDGVDSIDQRCQWTRHEAGPAAEVEDSASLVGDQPCQDIERLWWIWWAMSVGCGHSSITPGGGDIGP